MPETVTPAAACTAAVIGDSDCGEPAVGIIVSGCEHEHINEFAICAGCATDLQHHAAADGLFCLPCDHNCLLMAEIRFYDGTRVILTGPDAPKAVARA